MVDASNSPQLPLSPLVDPNLLVEGGQYLCPICRHGNIAQLTLMEAFACSFCRHVFDIDYERQVVRVVDSSQPVSWRWLNGRWVTSRPETGAIAIWITAAVLGILPPAVVGTAAYVFPPLPDSHWAWVPLCWSIVALLLHGGLATWILAEYHQPPIYAANKVRLSWWLQRFRPQS
ncbi:MAG: hypothetical protein AAF289_22655 [Cyanobacteria bacterium P01_A01_bin.135]